MAKRPVTAILATLLILVILQTVLVSVSSGEVYQPGQNLDFQLTATPMRAAVFPGGTMTYRVDVTSLGNFNSTVTVQITGGLPPGTQESFTPSSVAPAPGRPAVSVLTVATTATTPTGIYNITIMGSSTVPYIVHSIIVTLPVVHGVLGWSTACLW